MCMPDLLAVGSRGPSVLPLTGPRQRPERPTVVVCEPVPRRVDPRRCSGCVTRWAAGAPPTAGTAPAASTDEGPLCPPALASSRRVPAEGPFQYVPGSGWGGRGPSSVLDAEADGQPHLEVVDVAVDHLAADLLGLEPLDVPHRPRGLADRRADGVVDAGLAAADDLAQPVDVVGHGRLQGRAPGAVVSPPAERHASGGPPRPPPGGAFPVPSLRRCG